tara:strand:+ start:2212 stop:2985 length:774 start_codon:yes stop_codon:yes gene_type:complete
MNLILIIFIAFNNLNVNRVDEINKLFKSAEKSFINEDYKNAIEDYKLLIDSFEISNEKVYLNLAHSYYLLNDTANAIENYNYASITDDEKIKSIAYQQLGNINESKNNLEDALNYYKNSIISDNTNNDSKFNYELVKKKIESNKNNKEDKKEKEKNKSEEKNNDKKENQDKKDKNQDEEGKKDDDKKNQKNDDQKNDDKKSGEKNKEKSVEEKLKEINMTKEKAEMILDALNNNEFQYIQQLKRKPSKKKDKNKPDW